MLRISDFIKIMNLKYHFSSRHVRKKSLQFLAPLSIFCGFRTRFLMISGNPSSNKCQKSLAPDQMDV